MNQELQAQLVNTISAIQKLVSDYEPLEGTKQLMDELFDEVAMNSASLPSAFQAMLCYMSFSDYSFAVGGRPIRATQVLGSVSSHGNSVSRVYYCKYPNYNPEFVARKKRWLDYLFGVVRKKVGDRLDRYVDLILEDIPQYLMPYDIEYLMDYMRKKTMLPQTLRLHINTVCESLLVRPTTEEHVKTWLNLLTSAETKITGAICSELMFFCIEQALSYPDLYSCLVAGASGPFPVQEHTQYFVAYTNHIRKMYMKNALSFTDACRESIKIDNRAFQAMVHLHKRQCRIDKREHRMVNTEYPYIGITCSNFNFLFLMLVKGIEMQRGICCEAVEQCIREVFEWIDLEVAGVKGYIAQFIEQFDDITYNSQNTLDFLASKLPDFNIPEVSKVKCALFSKPRPFDYSDVVIKTVN